MITRFKIFENINGNPKVGDYVSFESYGDVIIAKITDINNNFDIYNEDDNPFPYTVEWESYGDSICPDAIIEWSENKEELELKLQAKKYNL